MKKKFNETKVGKLLKSKVGKSIGSLVTGALGVYLKPLAGGIVGIKEGLKQVKADNLNSEQGGKGKVNYVGLIGIIGSLLLLVAYLTGFLTEDKLEYSLEILNSLLGS
mgnify:CR=1 FL=1